MRLPDFAIWTGENYAVWQILKFHGYFPLITAKLQYLSNNTQMYYFVNTQAYYLRQKKTRSIAGCGFSRLHYF